MISTATRHWDCLVPSMECLLHSPTNPPKSSVAMHNCAHKSSVNRCPPLLPKFSAAYPAFTVYQLSQSTQLAQHTQLTQHSVPNFSPLSHPKPDYGIETRPERARSDGPIRPIHASDASLHEKMSRDLWVGGGAILKHTRRSLGRRSLGFSPKKASMAQ